MNDDEIIELLKLTIETEYATELNDEMVDSILLRKEECPSERTERVRKKYLEKLFEELNPEPVKKIDTRTTFGRWMESIRNRVQVSSSDIAAALRQQPDFIEKMERGEILPWDCRPEIFVDLMKLLRIHINAVGELIATSNSVSQVRGVGRVVARSRGGKVSKERGNSTARALEMFLAHNAPPANTGDPVVEWMKKVRGELKDRKLDDLVSSGEEKNQE